MHTHCMTGIVAYKSSLYTSGFASIMIYLSAQCGVVDFRADSPGFKPGLTRHINCVLLIGMYI